MQAIINYSTSNGWYQKGQIRLKKTLLQHSPDADVFMVQDFNVIQSPSHQEVPYGFKPYSLDYLRKKRV